MTVYNIINTLTPTTSFIINETSTNTVQANNKITNQMRP